MSPIQHIVSFKIQDESNQKTCAKAFLALKDECKNPETGKTYIVSIKGGKQHSPEGKHRDMTITFILEFENQDDLQYYLFKDPAHRSFGDKLGPLNVEDVVVLDFTEDQF